MTIPISLAEPELRPEVPGLVVLVVVFAVLYLWMVWAYVKVGLLPNKGLWIDNFHNLGYNHLPGICETCARLFPPWTHLK